MMYGIEMKNRHVVHMTISNMNVMGVVITGGMKAQIIEKHYNFYK